MEEALRQLTAVEISQEPTEAKSSLKQRLRNWALRRFYGLPSANLEELASDTATLKPAFLDDICMPPYYGPRDHDDFTPLMRALIQLRPKLVLELGTAHGNTVANICHFCPEATVVTVNAPAEAQTGNFITFSLAQDDIGRVYRKHGFAPRVRQVFQNTLQLDLDAVVQPGTADAAIIDACHDTDFVLNDFHKVNKYIRGGGLVFLHDTHPSEKEHLLGSAVACMKLRRQGFDISHVRDTWWGIWRKP
jgi:predicted O-methyltransferase YrrM